MTTFNILSSGSWNYLCVCMGLFVCMHGLTQRLTYTCFSYTCFSVNYNLDHVISYCFVLHCLPFCVKCIIACHQVGGQTTLISGDSPQFWWSALVRYKKNKYI